MELCHFIDKSTYVIYDPVRNEFLENGKEHMRITPAMEYVICKLLEQAEIAGLRQSEIMAIVADFVWHGQ